MSTTRILAVSLLFSTSLALAPAFADDRTIPGTQVAAIEAQLPVNATTELAPAVAAREDAARTGPAKNAEEVRALLFGVAPVDVKPGARINDQDWALIREVAGMYQFQHYRRPENLGTKTAGSDGFETAAYAADSVPR